MMLGKSEPLTFVQFPYQPMRLDGSDLEGWTIMVIAIVIHLF